MRSANHALWALLLIVGHVSSQDGPPPESPPGSIGKLMTDVADAVQQTVASPPDNGPAMSAILTDGLNEASVQAQAAQGDSLLGRVVRTLVEARLNTHFFTGMCPRNYTVPCPSGYEVQTDELVGKKPVACVLSSIEETTPPACASLDLRSAGTPAAKELFATKCSAQWPCAACTRDFSKCPLGWIPVGENDSLCQPPPGYLGLCPGITDFSRIKPSIDKARWAASCEDEWPCEPE